MSFVNPNTDVICTRLRTVKTVAVVGLSPNENRPSFRIARALQRTGMRIVPVRPLVEAPAAARGRSAGI
jgi:predicted CoA-binding protein